MSSGGNFCGLCMFMCCFQLQISKHPFQSGFLTLTIVFFVNDGENQNSHKFFGS